MKRLKRIILISLVFCMTAFASFAGGQQENETFAPNRPDNNSNQPDDRKMIPSGEELTVLRLQYFADNAESEPSIALSEEQISIILPVLKEWQAAVNEDINTDSSQFVETIVAQLTEDQSSFLPPPPDAEQQSGSSDRQGPPKGERPPKGQNPPEGQRPEAPEMPSVTEMLEGLIETLSEMI